MTKQLINDFLGFKLSNLMLPDKSYTLSKEGVAAPDLIVGLELEIENWRGAPHWDGFNRHEDGSLRNNGVEFVTHPTKTKFLKNLLQDFFVKNKVTEDNYSERCSTHVHVNCLDYTVPQLAALTLLYQTFERILFNFIGNDRDKNIFCVPWCQASITTNLANLIESGDWLQATHRWQKYTALNLASLRQRGTVEYRHLEGTCDINRIMTWVNIIAMMHEYARKIPIEDIKKTIMELNTSSAYDVFLKAVFGEYTNFLEINNFKEAMELGVIDAKIMLYKEDTPKKEIDWGAAIATSRRLQQREAEIRLERRQTLGSTIPAGTRIPTTLLGQRGDIIWADDFSIANGISDIINNNPVVDIQRDQVVNSPGQPVDDEDPSF